MTSLTLRLLGSKDGRDGVGLLFTDGPPAAGAGVVGQVAYDYTNHAQYGPKTSEGWGSGQSIVGSGGGSGNAIFTGSGAPNDATGSQGDIYINTANGALYQKGASTWGSPVANLTGPAGADGSDGAAGADGSDGADGADGATILLSNGAPDDGDGVDGDININTVNGALYQKAGGTWGSPSGNLTGPAGADGADGAPGADGADGQGVPAGGTANQVLTKQSASDFDAAWADAAGGGGGDLISTNNLSDVADADTARGNLNITDVSLSENQVPIATAASVSGLTIHPTVQPWLASASATQWRTNTLAAARSQNLSSDVWAPLDVSGGDGSYSFWVSPPVALALASVYSIRTDAGTLTAEINIDGVPVDGIDAIAVTATDIGAVDPATDNNSLSGRNLITVDVTNHSGASVLYLGLILTEARTLA